jgi:hypothetical protein
MSETSRASTCPADAIYVGGEWLPSSSGETGKGVQLELAATTRSS